MSEVADFLHGCGLPQYIDAFHQYGLRALSSIPGMTEDTYNMLGVKLGHRRKIFREVEKANRKGEASQKRVCCFTLG